MIKTCVACHGTGQIERGSSGPVTCRMCNGKGYVK